MTTPHYFRGLALLSFLAVLSACATQPGKLSEELRQGYLDGHRALQVGEYASAIAQLQKISARAPEPYGSQASLELMYAYHKQGDFAAARRSGEQFIARYATHPRADYAHYLRATAALQLSLQARGATLKQREHGLREAFTLFQDFSRLFPASDFNEKALLGLAFIRQQQALAQLDQAKLELNQRNNTAALVRLRHISTEFRGTPAAAEALALLGMPPQSDRLTAARPPMSAPSMLTRQNINTVATQAADTPPAAEAPVAIHDPQWILRQAPERYTLELLSAAPDEVNIFVTRHRIQGGAAYPAKPGGDTRQTLIHGLYPSAETAKMAAKQLSKRWGVSTPRIRQLGEVQDALTENGVLSASKR